MQTADLVQLAADLVHLVDQDQARAPWSVAHGPPAADQVARPTARAAWRASKHPPTPG